MGETIDFSQAAARRRRPLQISPASDLARANFKVGAGVALSMIESKALVLEALISSLDRSRHNVGSLEHQLAQLKSLFLLARTKIETL